MVRTQIQLQERQCELLRKVAHRKHISLSQAVREAVDAGLQRGLENAESKRGAAALLTLVAVGESGLGDLGRAHDRYFEEDSTR